MKIILMALFSFLVLFSCSKNSTDSGDDGPSTGTIRDIDGNLYKVFRIGKQWWMAENLKVTKYRNGEWIINVTGSATWSALQGGAYCYYDNNFDNAGIYGHMYNWHALVDPRNIAPEGWHVATDKDWQQLINYLGGEDVAGAKLKSTGTIEDGNGLWSETNEFSTNESGFSALPGGYRSWNGKFGGEGSTAYFWSSTETSSGTAYSYYLINDTSNVYRYDSGVKQAGYSIRCVKN